jgi:hypothetical protein
MRVLQMKPVWGLFQAKYWKQLIDSARKELPELVLEPLLHHHCDFFIQPNS